MFTHFLHCLSILLFLRCSEVHIFHRNNELKFSEEKNLKHLLDGAGRQHHSSWHAESWESFDWFDPQTTPDWKSICLDAAFPIAFFSLLLTFPSSLAFAFQPLVVCSHTSEVLWWEKLRRSRSSRKCSGSVGIRIGTFINSRTWSKSYPRFVLFFLCCRFVVVTLLSFSFSVFLVLSRNTLRTRRRGSIFRATRWREGEFSLHFHVSWDSQVLFCMLNLILSSPLNHGYTIWA